MNVPIENAIVRADALARLMIDEYVDWRGKLTSARNSTRCTWTRSPS